MTRTRCTRRFLQVMFVDYGNTEVISKYDVKKLDEDLQKSAPYAIELAFTMPMDGVPHQELASKLENKNLVVKIGAIQMPHPFPTALRLLQRLKYRRQSKEWY